MLEEILLKLPYFFGAIGIVILLFGIISAVFLKKNDSSGNSSISSGVALVLLALILYFVNPYIIQFLSFLG